MDWISKVVDDCLEKMRLTQILMTTPGSLPADMVDHSIPTSDDWKGWKPIPSVITDEDLDRFERKIKFPLPHSYREFLKYKHFVKLRLPNYAVGLGSNMPDHDLKALHNKIFNFHEPDLLIGRGYIYFADFNDYGLLCFDANEKRIKNEYKVVFIDHEDLDMKLDYADDFRTLVQSDPEHGNRFIDQMNNLYS